MSSLFRGALNLIQGEVSNVTNNGATHQLVGQDVMVGSVRLRIRNVIAEGGFAVVFVAQDQDGQSFALKRQLTNDRESVQAVINEINVLKELNGNPAIIRFFQAAQSKNQSGGTEFLILTELCTGGPVVDCLKSDLNPNQVIKIFYAASSAIKHMHCRKEPITHRDMKVENLLFDAKGFVKLCDFGSATKEIHYPDETWTPIRRTQLIEEMQRNTTPMYRAPEVQDEYMNMPVGPQQDVWALGCVLFYLCYRVHPFEDSAKLRIINAKYVIPKEDQEFTMFIPLIQSCLQIDPRHRPTIADLVERIKALSAAMAVDLNSPVDGIGNTSPNAREAQNPFGSSSPAPARPPPPRTDASEVSQQASAMFGALKGQGMSLFKNIKDRSAAVVQTVQSTYGGKGPDVSWVTARLVVAPQPDNVPEALAAQAEDSLRTFASDQARPYLVCNISQRRLKCEFPARPLEILFPYVSSGQCPTINQLLKICRELVQFLRQNPNGFVIVYGHEAHCVLLGVSLILYTRLLSRPLKAVELMSERRGTVWMPPSFHRAIDLLGRIVSSKNGVIRETVHNYPIRLNTILIEPLPLFNRMRTGCRPFAEIYSGGAKLWNTYRDYDQLKSFELPDNSSAELELGDVPVSDDVTIVVYHARWSKIQNKMQQTFMFSCGFHANFWNPKEQLVTFHHGDLDLNQEEMRYFSENFRVVLGLKIENHDRGFNNGVAEPPAFLGYDETTVDCMHLVENTAEFEHIQRTFEQGIAGGQPPRPAPPPAKQAAAPASSQPTQPNVPTTDFFGTLDWGSSAPVDPVVPKPTTNFVDDPFSTAGTTSTSQSSTNNSKSNIDTAESYERMYGIRVGKEEEDEDADKYKFDYEKKPSNMETPIMGQPTPVTSTYSEAPVQEFDLLGFGPSSSASQQPPPQDPFADVFGLNSTTSAPQPTVNNTTTADLFGDWNSASSQQMHRNASAPNFPQTSAPPPAFDPFAEFLSATPLGGSNPGSKQGSASNSGTSTPKPNRPNYSRSAFENVGTASSNINKPKVTSDTFGDLLSSQGFTSSAKSATRTIGDLRREDEIKELDPVQIKIRDWTKGKEKNIRALLGSLSEVLWDGVDNWQQPNMGELLSAAQVKKWYRKACLVVHPDKQTGMPHEELAKSVFTQLNEAWTAFEQAGSPSL